MTETEKTNIVSIVPNSNINTSNKGVIVVLSTLYIGNKNTAIQETSGGKHLIHISSTLKGKYKIRYLANLLHLSEAQIVNPDYHNTDIRITYWINGTLTDKRKDYFKRNFVQGAAVHDVVLEVTGYNSKYHQLEAKWLNNGYIGKPTDKPESKISQPEANTIAEPQPNTKPETVLKTQDTAIKASPQQSIKQANNTNDGGVLRMEDLNLS